MSTHCSSSLMKSIYPKIYCYYILLYIIVLSLFILRNIVVLYQTFKTAKFSINILRRKNTHWKNLLSFTLLFLKYISLLFVLQCIFSFLDPSEKQKYFSSVEKYFFSANIVLNLMMTSHFLAFFGISYCDVIKQKGDTAYDVTYKKHHSLQIFEKKG